MKNGGFTLVELIISVGLIAILSVVGFLNLANYKRSQSISSSANEIVATLRNAQNYSLSQEGGAQWGVYFQNTGAGAFYSLFQGAAYSSASTTFQNVLPSGVKFVLPASGASSSVVFAPITGLPNAVLIIKIALINNPDVSNTITVTPNGSINITSTISYIITASAGANGSISPQGAVFINKGDSQSFAISPDTGYSVASVLVDDADQGSITSYNFTNIQTNHTISATFTTPPLGSPGNFAANGNTAQTIGLSWNPVSGATSYNVYWGNSPGITSGSTKISNIATTTYSHTSRSSGTTYYYKVSAVSAGGESSLSSEIGMTTPGQNAYTASGTISWVAPVGVTSVSVVAVGGGGAGDYNGGGGGGLGYKSNIAVTPGNSYTVVVGAEGDYNNYINGQNSYFISTSTVMGIGGQNGSSTGSLANRGGPGGSYIGDGGGIGGRGGGSQGCSGGYFGGGGGAGGYSGTGGNGGPGPSAACGLGGSGTAGTGSSAGAGAGGSSGYGGAAGGGVGLNGAGGNGSGGTPIVSSTGNAGRGGSGGQTPTTGYVLGGAYGGGSGGMSGVNGGSGAVRIIWPGSLRQFPSTRAADE